jgi:hypothetical protein
VLAETTCFGNRKPSAAAGIGTRSCVTGYVRYQTDLESTFASVGLQEGARRPFGAWSVLPYNCNVMLM